ncbi:MAG: MaoC family dehydratase [Candidatus Entotheonella gemina]|uniref:MaoC family dehydratase n=1 Tax=Candidatus Entotheonella gemina TaxID=1429439 RepID=W4LF63_9BACT|nr:MAG: MaoC family dehydratase [Candidatus Entotheonella gemina]
MSALEKAYEVLSAAIGTESPPGDWFTVTQDQVNRFADVTGDHQWIHVDIERAKNGPFGAPIAHGHLTLSILGLIGKTDKPSNLPTVEGQKMGINYGFNKVRFPAPVPVGARIRSTRTLKSVEIKGGMIEVMNEVVVEVEGQDKPACVAESLARMVF